ncbi:MAG: HAD-IA family hydrolase [Azospirillaceae bacterium]|nr:HAD-IA family hydrolase [Azospirillaceae bacterium]
MITTTPSLALFDCDGTLVDSQHAIVAAMTAAWRCHGLADPDPAAVRRIVGLSLLAAVAALLPQGMPRDHERLAELYKEAFRDQRRLGTQEEPLYPGAVAALDALAAAGVWLGVATGKGRRGLMPLLEHHALTDRFVTLQTADDGPGKPHPDMIHRAQAVTGVDADRVVMIGDTSFDMLMAVAAGVGAVGVAWGYHDVAELTAAGADHIVDDFAAVPATVLGLLPRTGTES